MTDEETKLLKEIYWILRASGESERAERLAIIIIRYEVLNNK